MGLIFGERGSGSGLCLDGRGVADWCGFLLAAPVRRFTELRFFYFFGFGNGSGWGWEVSVASLLRIGAPEVWEFSFIK